ncbi:TetR family transcriptional regulator C-terminal domain-containing protein [Bradyrhizobium cenepequi]
MRRQTQAIAAKARIRKINEERITTAAIAAFANKGAHGTTIAEIAASLDMPTATVHYYFKNKETLYDAVLQQIVHLWFSKIAGIEDGEDPLAEIEKYVRSKMEFSRQYPEASRIFASDILGGHANILSKVETEIRPIVAKKCELIDGWIRMGRIRPIDPLNLFFMIWGITEYYANFASEIGVFFDGKPMPDAEFEKAVQAVVDLVVNGCRPAGQSGVVLATAGA